MRPTQKPSPRWTSGTGSSGCCTPTACRHGDRQGPAVRSADRTQEAARRRTATAHRAALLSGMTTRRALLLIADIGGYTEYMQYHRSMLGHAEAATRRLLDKIVGAARGFDLIEIEGDAAFLSRDAEGLDGAATLSAVTSAAVAMHRAFHAQRRLIELNMCPCRSCTQTSALKLKFVAHVGDVATQTIKRRKKLVGMDVIYVHRLLKNSVHLPEYVLVSEELYREGGAAQSE